MTCRIPPRRSSTSCGAPRGRIRCRLRAFSRKQASGTRRLGTRAIEMINRRIFGQPPDLTVSNFRLLRRDVVDRICKDRSATPYITGLALLYSHKPGNASVEHPHERRGRATTAQCASRQLVVTILFSYSAFPLRLFAVIGFVVAVVAFVTGSVYLVMGLTGNSRVEGWTSLSSLPRFWRCHHRHAVDVGRVSGSRSKPDQ